MRKAIKVLTTLVFVIGLIVFICKIVQLYRKKNVKSFLVAALDAHQTESLVDISGRGVRFVGQKNDQIEREFEALMANKGCVPIGTFGRSTLYSCGGNEVLVKKTCFFNHFYLYEIMDETYMSLLEVA
jgi:hypothetical protein